MKKQGSGYFRTLLVPVAAAGILLCFFWALSNLTRDKAEEDRLQLEKSLKKAAVACYASEGMYPPDPEYLETHYGVRINHSRYVVVYDIFASNLMPDITVLEVLP